MRRVFTSRVAAHLRLVSVVYPLFGAAALGIAGLVFNLWSFSALSAALTLWSVFVWPFSRMDRAQLAFSSEGFAIDGLGRLSWSKIAGIRFESLKQGRSGLLSLNLAAPVSLALELDERRRLPRAVQAKIWRITGAQSLKVAIGGLEDSPEDIVQALGEISGKTISR